MCGANILLSNLYAAGVLNDSSLVEREMKR